MKRYLLPALALVLVACLDEREETTDTGATDPDAATDATTADAAVDMLPPDAAPNLLELGAECVAHAECTSGRCSVPCDGYGTCVPAECDADADCAEQGACCVDGACEASTGGTCGDRSGGQGDACSNGPTDCADGVACINRCLAAPFCAAACEGHDECRAADPATACYRTPEGDARCVPDPDQAARCERNADCGPTAVCVPFISFDGTGIIKTCLQTQGGRPVGAACPEHRTCRSTYCLDGRCTAGCAEDADCACEADGCRQQTCLDVWFDYRDEQHPARMCLRWQASPRHQHPTGELGPQRRSQSCPTPPQECVAAHRPSPCG